MNCTHHPAALPAFDTFRTENAEGCGSFWPCSPALTQRGQYVIVPFLFPQLPARPYEVGARPHLFGPYALRLWPGQWRGARRGPVEGARARASPEAPERHLEKWPGSSAKQGAKRGAAIAWKRGGARRSPCTRDAHLSHCSISHSSSSLFCCSLKHKPLSPSSKTSCMQTIFGKRERGETRWKLVVPLSQKSATTLILLLAHWANVEEKTAPFWGGLKMTII